MLSSERSGNECAVAKNSNADRNSALCFTACPRTGVLKSSDDTLCNFERGLSPQRCWEHAPCVRRRNACPRTGVLRSSDDTLCNCERGLSPQRRWATFMPSKPSETAKSISSRHETHGFVLKCSDPCGPPWPRRCACISMPKGERPRFFSRVSRSIPSSSCKFGSTTKPSK